MIDRTKLPNTFEFVVTAGQRARQLLAGSTPRVDVGANKKTTVAAREVLAGAVQRLSADEVAALKAEAAAAAAAALDVEPVAE